MSGFSPSVGAEAEPGMRCIGTQYTEVDASGHAGIGFKGGTAPTLWAKLGFILLNPTILSLGFNAFLLHPDDDAFSHLATEAILHR